MLKSQIKNLKKTFILTEIITGNLLQKYSKIKSRLITTYYMIYTIHNVNFLSNI